MSVNSLITPFYTDRIYYAVSTEGYTFRIRFTRSNDKFDSDVYYEGYEGFECYDDNYTRYVYYTKNPYSRDTEGFLETFYGDVEYKRFDVEMSLHI